VNRQEISVRQYLTLLSVGLLPALVKLVPGHQAVYAGRGAWLGPLAALGPVLLILWLMSSVGSALPEGSGLGKFYCLCLGNKLGRLVCGISGLWLLVVGCFGLRFCAERFVSTIYPDTGLGLFFLSLLAMVWWLSRRELVVTARAGQMFFYSIAAMLVLILGLVAGELRLNLLWPVWMQDAPVVLRAGWDVLNAMSVGMGGLFLFSDVGSRRGGGKLAAKWACGCCGVLTLLSIEVIGTFGAQLAGRMTIPFFSLAKEVRPERLESLVAAAWVFADVILLSVILRSAHAALECALDRELPGLEGALVLLLLPGAYLAAGSTFALETAYDKWESVGKSIVFLALPLAALVVGKLRRVV
jgi:hypothetical protein